MGKNNGYEYLHCLFPPWLDLKTSGYHREFPDYLRLSQGKQWKIGWTWQCHGGSTGSTGSTLRWLIRKGVLVIMACNSATCHDVICDDMRLWLKIGTPPRNGNFQRNITLNQWIWGYHRVTQAQIIRKPNGNYRWFFGSNKKLLAPLAPWAPAPRWARHHGYLTKACLVGGPRPPLWKIWLRQLGWLETQY